jgi:hypothetical protein
MITLEDHEEVGILMLLHGAEPYLRDFLVHPRALKAPTDYHSVTREAVDRLKNEGLIEELGPGCVLFAWAGRENRRWRTLGLTQEGRRRYQELKASKEWREPGVP